VCVDILSNVPTRFEFGEVGGHLRVWALVYMLTGRVMITTGGLNPTPGNSNSAFCNHLSIFVRYIP